MRETAIFLKRGMFGLHDWGTWERNNKGSGTIKVRRDEGSESSGSPGDGGKKRRVQRYL